MRWKRGSSPAWGSSMTALSLLFLFLFVFAVAAQDNELSDLPPLNSLSSVGDESTSDSAEPTSTSDSAEPTSTADDESTTTTARATSTETTNDASRTTASDRTTITGADVTLTGGISMSSTSSSEEPTSKETGTSSIFHLSDLPTVAGATIPTQVIPYTAGAPFMQKSSLPEGTVFIIVGAILGFFAMCVLAWRGLVAWSLARSVKRAALAQQQTFDFKSTAYTGAAGGMYSAPTGSGASLERLTAAVPVKSAKRRPHASTPAKSDATSTTTPPVLNNRTSTQNLFFSPTAGAGHHSAMPSPHTTGNRASAYGGDRGSTYLPAGYYASGSSQPAGGAGTAHINAHAAPTTRGSIINPISDRFSGLRAESAGYQRAHSFGPSPPASPSLAATPVSRVGNGSPGNASSVVGNVGGAGLYSQQSQSSLNLSIPGGTATGGRTPSAYLEDLFDNHGNGPRERF